MATAIQITPESQGNPEIHLLRQYDAYIDRSADIGGYSGRLLRFDRWLSVGMPIDHTRHP